MHKTASLLAVFLMLAVAATAYGASAATKHKKPQHNTKPTVQYGLVLRVVIMPPQNAEAKQISQLQPLAVAIGKVSSLYLPWVYDSGKCNWGKCRVSDADIIIHTTLKAQAVQFDSFDVRSNQPIGASSAESLDTVKDMKPTDVQKLLGTPKIDGNTVLTDSQYVQYVLIVPQTSSDAAYIPLVQHLLERQGFVAFPSQYTYASLDGAGDVTSICAHGERYFVYTVNTNTDAKKWIGFTRIGANANGFLADCVTHRAFHFTGESTRSVPTSSATFTGLAQILKLGFLPHFDWSDIGTATTAVAQFADVTPTSNDVQYPVVETSLQKSVDSMCEVLSHERRRQAVQGQNATFNNVTAKNLTAQNITAQTLNGIPIPQATESPAALLKGELNASSGANTSGNQQQSSTPTTQAATPQLAFNVGALMGPEPFPLDCSGPRINVPPTPRPNGSGLFGSFSDGSN